MCREFGRPTVVGSVAAGVRQLPPLGAVCRMGGEYTGSAPAAGCGVRQLMPLRAMGRSPVGGLVGAGPAWIGSAGLAGMLGLPRLLDGCDRLLAKSFGRSKSWGACRGNSRDMPGVEMAARTCAAFIDGAGLSCEALRVCGGRAGRRGGACPCLGEWAIAVSLKSATALSTSRGCMASARNFMNSSGLMRLRLGLGGCAGRAEVGTAAPWLQSRRHSRLRAQFRNAYNKNAARATTRAGTKSPIVSVNSLDLTNDSLLASDTLPEDVL